MGLYFVWVVFVCCFVMLLVLLLFLLGFLLFGFLFVVWLVGFFFNIGRITSQLILKVLREKVPFE